MPAISFRHIYFIRERGNEGDIIQHPIHIFILGNHVCISTGSFGQAGDENTKGRVVLPGGSNFVNSGKDLEAMKENTPVLKIAPNLKCRTEKMVRTISFDQNNNRSLEQSEIASKASKCKIENQEESQESFKLKIREASFTPRVFLMLI